MNCIIAGSRTIQDYYLVAAVIERSGFAPLIRQVVCGESLKKCLSGKINVDILGYQWATRRGIPVKHFEVTQQEWDFYGKPAGPMRNARMAAYADALILVWDGVSRGSKSMLELAEAAHLLIYAPPLSEFTGQLNLWSAEL